MYTSLCFVNQNYQGTHVNFLNYRGCLGNFFGNFFNINHKLDENRPAPEAEQQSAYLNITDFILEHPNTAHDDDYALICADIHRLRGDFQLAKHVYDTVIDKELDYIVQQAKGWCDDKNTRLMLIPVTELDG